MFIYIDHDKIIERFFYIFLEYLNDNEDTICVQSIVFAAVIGKYNKDLLYNYMLPFYILFPLILGPL